jgi:hypothetical protein
MTKKHQETPRPQPKQQPSRPQPQNEPKPLIERKGVGSEPRPKR